MRDVRHDHNCAQHNRKKRDRISNMSLATRPISPRSEMIDRVTRQQRSSVPTRVTLTALAAATAPPRDSGGSLARPAAEFPARKTTQRQEHTALANHQRVLAACAHATLERSLGWPRVPRHGRVHQPHQSLRGACAVVQSHARLCPYPCRPQHASPLGQAAATALVARRVHPARICTGGNGR